MVRGVVLLFRNPSWQRQIPSECAELAQSPLAATNPSQCAELASSPLADFDDRLMNAILPFRPGSGTQKQGWVVCVCLYTCMYSMYWYGSVITKLKHTNKWNTFMINSNWVNLHTSHWCCSGDFECFGINKQIKWRWLNLLLDFS